jgi:hypothetical protein
MDIIGQVPLGDVPISAGLKIAPPHLRRVPQSQQFRRLLGLSLLDQAQPITQNLAGVLITARLDQGVDQIMLVIGQDDISSRHPRINSAPISTLR